MRARLALVIVAAAALGGCARREISTEQRLEAANIASEAEFAVTIKDWSRAEGLYAKATDLCPDSGDTWIGLGVSRVRLGNHPGAKSAFKSAASAYAADFDRNPANTGDVVREAYALVLLGRADDARSALDKASKASPDDRILRGFAENGGVDKLLSDPAVKDDVP